MKSNYGGVYSAPECKVIDFAAQTMLCTSPYGENNRAGKTLSEDDDYTYDL